jgi:hypothetical protein
MLLTVTALLHTTQSIWLLNKWAKKGSLINIITDSGVSDLNNLWETGVPKLILVTLVFKQQFHGTKV